MQYHLRGCWNQVRSLLEWWYVNTWYRVYRAHLWPYPRCGSNHLLYTCLQQLYGRERWGQTLWNSWFLNAVKLPVLKGHWDHEEVEPMWWIIGNSQNNSGKKRFNCLWPLQRSFGFYITRFQFFSLDRRWQTTDRQNQLLNPSLHMYMWGKIMECAEL